MDSAGQILYAANELYIRADNTTATTPPKEEKPTSYKIIGLVLALSSGIFIGVSFVLKKKGLLAANAKYHQEAGEGYAYLKNFWWWSGMTLMIMGEICNFAAYLFTDPILVTPLGALSVVVTAMLSGIFLKERLSFVGKIGCFMCIVGSIVIAVNAPEQSSVSTIQDMLALVRAPGFLSFMCVIIVVCIIVAVFLGPRYGKKTMMVYITVCSLIGGLSVSGIQGLGAAITSQAKGIPQFNFWFTYVLLIFIIVTLVTEIIFLNKALNLYNAALVTPTYYVYFTSAVIVTSAVLYQGFKGTTIQIVTVVLGFLQICAGVVLLQLSKSSKDVPDTAVFSGDLDQVRTIAEVEEPEYEPRADAIRGGSAIIRSLSRARQSRQIQEIEKLREEHLRPIGEDEEVEFDGVRRRRTISGSRSPSAGIRRSRTIHPPLGMSQFPDEDSHHEEDDDYHPGIFHFRRKHRSVRSDARSSHTITSQPPMPLSPIPHKTPEAMEIERMESQDSGRLQPHVYGLPPGLRPASGLSSTTDTTYRGASGSQHIHFAGNVDDRPSSRGASRASAAPSGATMSPQAPSISGFAPPPIPPSPRDNNHRQFSFSNVFNRSRPSSAAGTNPSVTVTSPPLSRAALSFTRKTSHQGRSVGGSNTDGTTEEERLGLVKGDSHLLGERESPSMSPHDSSDDEGRYQRGHYRDADISVPRHLTGAAGVGSEMPPQAPQHRFSVELAGQTRSRIRPVQAEDEEHGPPRLDDVLTPSTGRGAFL